jgi:hypothetical protein
MWHMLYSLLPRSQEFKSQSYCWRYLLHLQSVATENLFHLRFSSVKRASVCFAALLPKRSDTQKIAKT